MVSSVWIGSVPATAVLLSGQTSASETQVLVWQGPRATVSAQAALSAFGYDVAPGPTVAQGNATALISSYRVFGLTPPTSPGRFTNSK